MTTAGRWLALPACAAALHSRRATALEGVERLVLGVESGNEAARALYHTFGFATYGIEPQAYKLDGRYWDSEMMTLDLRE
jgi:RimJ/RimL family protein N-acetyltransferase